MSSQIMTMEEGDQSLIVTSTNEMSYLRCIKGSVRVFSHRCGVGWSFAEGEHFVLRAGTRYRIAANATIKLALHNVDSCSRSPAVVAGERI